MAAAAVPKQPVQQSAVLCPAPESVSSSVAKQHQANYLRLRHDSDHEHKLLKRVLDEQLFPGFPILHRLEWHVRLGHPQYGVGDAILASCDGTKRLVLELKAMHEVRTFA